MPWFWVILTDDFHRSANLQGWVGRDAYTWDSTLPYRCELDAQARYCVRPTVPGPGGQGSELFLDGRVNSHEAVAWHGYAGEGTQPGWRVTWYDPGQDVTYRVHLFGCIPSPRVCRGPDLAGEVSDWQLSPDNRGPAEALMRRIATFVPIEVK